MKRAARICREGGSSYGYEMFTKVWRYIYGAWKLCAAGDGGRADGILLHAVPDWRLVQDGDSLSVRRAWRASPYKRGEQLRERIVVSSVDAVILRTYARCDRERDLAPLQLIPAVSFP